MLFKGLVKSKEARLRIRRIHEALAGFYTETKKIKFKKILFTSNSKCSVNKGPYSEGNHI